MKNKCIQFLLGVVTAAIYLLIGAAVYCLIDFTTNKIVEASVNDYKEDLNFAEYFDPVKLAESGNNTIYYDKNTKVMWYVLNDGFNNSYAIHILNPDGTPKLYEGD